MLKKITGENIAYFGIVALILLIPFQIYFNIYPGFPVSIAQIFSGIMLFIVLWINRHAIKDCAGFGLDWAVIAFLCAMLVSIGVSDDRFHSVKTFIKWSSFVVLYFLAKTAVKHEGAVKRLITVFAVSAAIVSVIGLFEYISGPVKVMSYMSGSSLPPVIMEPNSLKVKLSGSGNNNWLAWSGKDLVVRVFGTFEDSLSLTAFLGLIIPFLLAGIASKNSYLNLAASALIFFTLFFALARSAYISFIVIIVFTAFLRRREKVFKNIIKVSGIMLLTVIVLIISSKSIRHTLNSRIISPPHASGVPRIILWSNGLKIFCSRPLLGVGTANYQHGLDKYCGQNPPSLPAHNEYIQRAAETGTVGLITYLLIIFFGVKYSYEIFRKGKSEDMRMMGVGFLGMWVWYCVQTLFITNLFGDKYSMMFWLMVGLNAGLYRVHLSQMVEGPKTA